jgi:hypothetical protein
MSVNLHNVVNVIAGKSTFDYSGTISENGECQEVVRGIVSSSTGLSTLDVTLDDTTHTLELPVGVYNYRVNGRNTNCSFKVEIKGTA